MSAPTRTFTVRHVQLARAAFAAMAALMITFSPDHSAQVGLSVFSGYVGTSALIFGLAAWLVGRTGTRWPYIVLGLVSMLASMVGGVPAWRSDVLFFVVVIAWAVGTGIVEFVVGWRSRATDPEARDGVLVGGATLLLAVVLPLVPVGYSLNYTIDGAGTFTLTGIIVAVGIFGAYAAIVAVLLGIAGLTPRRPMTDAAAVASGNQNGAAA